MPPLTCAQCHKASNQRGITVVELMVTVSLMVFLVFLAAPNFATWINNTRIRTVSEVLQNGARFAQAEAIRRNRSVVFYLTNAEPSLAAAAAANGSNWGARTLSLFAADVPEFIRGGALSDVAPGVLINGPAAICFNAAGQQITVAAEGCVAGLASYVVRRPEANPDLRRLRIDVSLGGRVRMCDPDKVLSATVPEGC
ncbi:GspH/FimT family pseudopilin [Rhizobacter sp. AJA081-3]|uniref:GspH/FimT family pseudopilin n=1 Tax=Rhizobacter sp. AJA081-3 TaxID=2753607 RepID=UPI001AE072EA|nr:GspH/FimT family pseudopilin [Rhizobacter sp. AJA081-3]QTN21882.1 GspH/FimT family pseudopilin [Rhizobacter sp. AJA081-3]